MRGGAGWMMGWELDRRVGSAYSVVVTKVRLFTNMCINSYFCAQY